jgi:hypothetical protein
MCDYSLQFVVSRPAKVGETLISTRFPHSATRGFASVEDRDVAVCLLPGTELAFEKDVLGEPKGLFRAKREFGHSVAQFRQINVNQHNVHHDALEFPDGQTVLLTELCEGQRATVLQLPAGSQATAGRQHVPETAI